MLVHGPGMQFDFRGRALHRRIFAALRIVIVGIVLRRIDLGTFGSEEVPTAILDAAIDRFDDGTIDRYLAVADLGKRSGGRVYGPQIHDHPSWPAGPIRQVESRT